MKISNLALVSAVVGTFAAGIAMGDGHAADVVKQRNDVMEALSKNLKTLGDMAKGEQAYDAAVAAEAATLLVAAAQIDPDTLYIDGTSTAEFEKTRAKPEIWDNLEDVKAKSAALADAAVAMEAAAGVDLASLQAAMGPLGQSCGSCHKVYRAPKN